MGRRKTTVLNAAQSKSFARCIKLSLYTSFTNKYMHRISSKARKAPTSESINQKYIFAT